MFTNPAELHADDSIKIQPFLTFMFPSLRVLCYFPPAQMSPYCLWTVLRREMSIQLPACSDPSGGRFASLDLYKDVSEHAEQASKLTFTQL